MFGFLLKKQQRPKIIFRTAPEPAEYIDRNVVKINMEIIKRLEYLSGRGAWLREQMEAAAEECCYLLGCEYESADCSGDIASEIIYCGIEVGEALDMIIDIKNGEHE